MTTARYIIATLFLMALPVQGEETALRTVESGPLKGITIEPDPDDNSRMLLHLDALLEDFTDDIDKHLHGDLVPGCSKRAYRSGRTEIRSGGKHISLRTSFRAEWWSCVLFKTRLVRSTHPVHWSMRLNTPARLDELHVSAYLDNIKDFPDELEELFDLRGKLTSIKVPVPPECGKCSCSDLAEKLKPVAERFRFEPQSKHGLIVKGVFSFPRDLTALAMCMQ